MEGYTLSRWTLVWADNTSSTGKEPSHGPSSSPSLVPPGDETGGVYFINPRFVQCPTLSSYSEKIKQFCKEGTRKTLVASPAIKRSFLSYVSGHVPPVTHS